MTKLSDFTIIYLVSLKEILIDTVLNVYNVRFETEKEAREFRDSLGEDFKESNSFEISFSTKLSKEDVEYLAFLYGGTVWAD